MKVVIGGQLGKQEIKVCLDKLGVDSVVKDDMSAAMDVKTGQADLYLGACLTGGGGALAMAITILGYGACKALTSCDVDVIEQAANAGVKAFGFTPGMTEQVVPRIIEAVSAK